MLFVSLSAYADQRLTNRSSTAMARPGAVFRNTSHSKLPRLSFPPVAAARRIPVFHSHYFYAGHDLRPPYYEPHRSHHTKTATKLEYSRGA